MKETNPIIPLKKRRGEITYMVHKDHIDVFQEMWEKVLSQEYKPVPVTWERKYKQNMEQHRWIDQYGLLLENDPAGNGGKGDALLRSFYLLFCYAHTDIDLGNNTKIMKGIIEGAQQCKKDYLTNGLLRHPNLTDENDTSMDAVIGWILIRSLESKVLETDPERFKRYVSLLPRQISDEYRWKGPWWNWVQYMAGKKKGNWFLWSCIGLGIAYWHVPIWKFLGIKNGKYYLNFFNLHLVAWMMFHVKDSLLKKIAKKFLLPGIPKSNALIRLLLGAKYNQDLVYSSTGWKWQRLPWVKYKGITQHEKLNYQDFPIDTWIIKTLEG